LPAPTAPVPLQGRLDGSPAWQDTHEELKVMVKLAMIGLGRSRVRGTAPDRDQHPEGFVDKGKEGFWRIFRLPDCAAEPARSRGDRHSLT
jgi:hypothetical protein